jgi:hypothetical protein
VQSKSFKLYEDFCSNFELLLQDVSLLRGSIPNWETFEGGIESLSKSVTSLENKLLTDNRSMSLSDLVVKVFPNPASRSAISVLTSLSQFSAFVSMSCS